MAVRNERVWLSYDWHKRTWSATKTKPVASISRVIFDIQAEIDVPEPVVPVLKLRYVVPAAEVRAVSEGAELE